MDASPDAELLRALRRAALAHAQRTIDEERATADRLRALVLPKVREEVARARREGLVGRAWLFGSFAWGDPTNGSDVDVLVEGCSEPFRLAARIGRAADREVHVVERETAARTLADRAVAEGMEL